MHPGYLRHAVNSAIIYYMRTHDILMFIINEMSLHDGQFFPTGYTYAKQLEFDEEGNLVWSWGKCLSTEYLNNLTHLIWECSDSHQWVANLKLYFIRILTIVNNT